MNEQDLIIYNKGINEGKKHITPSFDTKDFMEKTKLTMGLMKKDIENIIDSLKTNTEEHKEIRIHQHEVIEKIEGWMEKMEDKYTEKSQFEFWRNILVSGIFLSIFLGIIALVTEKILA